MTPLWPLDSPITPKDNDESPTTPAWSSSNPLWPVDSVPYTPLRLVDSP